jgi:hypothetical protein
LIGSVLAGAVVVVSGAAAVVVVSAAAAVVVVSGAAAVVPADSSVVLHALNTSASATKKLTLMSQELFMVDVLHASMNASST